VDVLDLTRRLIEIESITGKEQRICDFISRTVEEIGFNVTRHSVEGDRTNVVARIGDPKVVLTTHMDTVSPHVQLSEDAEYLYGRGACDAKGILAAMIETGRTLLEEGVRDFGMLFVVGEERGSDGARAANRMNPGSRFFINGEPTENRLALGSKGALRFEIRTRGRSAHSAYPEMGENAVDKLLDILQDFRGHAFPAHDVLGGTTLNIGILHGGTLANVVPDRASAEVIVRLVVGANAYKKIIGEIVRERAEVVYHFECDPVLLEPLEGFETTVVAYTTDIPLLLEWGRPFLFGPGSILDAHCAGERISKKQIREAVPLYRRLVTELLNVKETTA
jgi:acetylornithine deacetylase